MRLAASLPQLRSLQQLSLNRNPLSDDGVRFLERDLLTSGQMPALRRLSIENVDATPAAAEALREKLLRSVASRPQSTVAKKIAAQIELYSFLVSKALDEYPCARMLSLLIVMLVPVLVIYLVAEMVY